MSVHVVCWYVCRLNMCMVCECMFEFLLSQATGFVPIDNCLETMFIVHVMIQINHISCLMSV